jgi:glucose/arabinose dehydrogenase
MKLINILHSRTLLITSILVGLASCTFIPSRQASNAQETTAQQSSSKSECTLVEEGFGASGAVNIGVEEVATGLEVPWGIAFLPNGEMLVTERAGRIRLVRDGELQPESLATIDVSDSGEGGLLGIAAHPDFANNRLFYVYYTFDKNGTEVNRVERWQLSQDGLSASSNRIIIDDIPVALYHNGGRLRFGPDGMLYIGTGDAKNPESAQNIDSLAGKILRLTPDGQVPADNPFPNNPAFMIGIRNTQGFDWLNESTLVVTDHGPSGELGRTGEDKVLVAQAGDNLGWPTTQNCQAGENSVTPSLVWREAVPPGGAAIYTGNAIPEWQGSLIIATLGSEHLHRVVFDPQSLGSVQSHEVYLQNEFGRLREAIASPDGELYITTSNCDGRGTCPPEQDKILRIVRQERF